MIRSDPSIRGSRNTFLLTGSSSAQESDKPIRASTRTSAVAAGAIDFRNRRSHPPPDDRVRRVASGTASRAAVWMLVIPLNL
jgi:hypothetical protein